jgi:hypothetical protein
MATPRPERGRRNLIGWSPNDLRIGLQNAPGMHGIYITKPPSGSSEREAFFYREGAKYRDG